MLPDFLMVLVATLFSLISFLPAANAADCTTATVGDPYNDCYDIWTAAGITSDEFYSYNPGIDCSLLVSGQKVCISSGSLPSDAPSPYPNGTCYEYTVVSQDTCSSIAVKFDITADDIETWNEDTYKWEGCNDLQIGFVLCVSPGTPPPIPIDPNAQCGPTSSGNATCPLKACCSAFGYCGLTDEFCSTTGANPCQSNCFIPSLPSCSAPSSPRKIGYYAGWATGRPCGVIYPSQIDWSGYTHAHYAFATISEDFEIVIADTDVPLLQELVAQKEYASGLKVVIAVGGWTFSEADPSKQIFSLMIATETSRSTFISSVESALNTYGLDGIDIDFEYPGAVERDAPATDTPNLTAFFSEISAALPNAIVSIATPAGYWFIKGFEIDKIADYVTYMNMMSYDYHGPWDTNVTDQPSVTNPQTSIVDIETSTELYVRAGIDLSIVNLGLAWYGRTYHLQDPTCTGYNCTMTGGGAAGECDQASGVLAQFEILDMISNGNTPIYDGGSETYWFDTDGDLVTFDQDDTWSAKTDFAESTCFGGTFIWSMDQIIPGTDGTGVGSNKTGSGSGSGSGEAPTYSIIPWNPNPYPASAAPSETFVASGATYVIPVPTTTTAITVGGNVITLGPGGTPIMSLVPTGVSQPNAVTPSWTYQIAPPSGARTLTFTAPISGSTTYATSIVAPATPGAPAAIVTGPPGDTNCDGSNQWAVAYGPSISGCLPADVGVPGGTTPSAAPPSDWTGAWIDPQPPFTTSNVAPSASYSYITWNPNPFPPSAASSETIILSGTTTTFPIPSTTTSLLLAGATITLNPGGTPINSPVPTGFSIVSGITPTWTYYISPTPSASTVTYTAPLTSAPTWTSTVPIPSASNAPASTVTGPPGDHDLCDQSTNVWSLLFGGSILGCMPADVGIQGGITPKPMRPPGWTGSWTDPFPIATGEPDDGSEPSTTTTGTSTSTSSSSSSSSSAPACTPANFAELYNSYDLPDDPGNADWEDEGTDPDYKRKRGLLGARVPIYTPRHIAVQNCISVESPQAVLLGAGPYLTLDDTTFYTGTDLSVSYVNSRPSQRPAVQEHIFELGYINQFFTNGPITDCDWIKSNVFNYVRADGSTLGSAILAAIDNTDNMVWADVPMNQAKSNVVNGNSNSASSPPQLTTMQYIRINQAGDTNLESDLADLETFIRNQAALGEYFGRTSSIFAATALNVQNLLAEITPPTNGIPDQSTSVPLLFYNWLHDLVSGYPNGCVSRSGYTWTYYQNTVQLLIASGVIDQQLECSLPLYNYGTVNPSSFTYTDLLPVAPTSSRCNVPGSLGYPGYRDPQGNHYILFDDEFTVMGSGRTDSYAIGTGTTLSGSHLQATDVSGTTGCGGVYSLADAAPNSGDTPVYVNFDCASQTDPGGAGTFNTMTYYINNQPLSCAIIFNDEDVHSATSAFLCGPDGNAVSTCASSVAAGGDSGDEAIIISTVWFTHLNTGT